MPTTQKYSEVSKENMLPCWDMLGTEIGKHRECILYTFQSNSQQNTKVSKMFKSSEAIWEEAQTYIGIICFKLWKINQPYWGC